MTSPFLLARKPKDEQPTQQTEVGQTTRRPLNINAPLQSTTPSDVEQRPLWMQKTDAARQQSTNNTINITPQASYLSAGYSNIFPTIKAIGDTALAGQTAATEQQHIRAAAIERARIDAANQKAIRDAYARSAAIPTGAAGPTSTTSGSQNYTGNVTYDGSDASIADMMRKAGFPESAIATGLGVVQAESSGRANATNHNSNGSTDSGLFQINSIHSALYNGQNIFDPQTNVNIAYQVWKNAGNSWTPWVTFNNGVTPHAVPRTRLTATPSNFGGVYSTGNGTLRNQVVNRAMVVENLPYVWGGNSLTSGVDCSGLVYAVYKELGIPVPGRGTAESYSQEGAVGHRVSSISQLRPGDLIAFQWAGGYRGAGAASHIAIYAGNGQIIEAYGGSHGRRRALTNSAQDRGAIYLSVRFPGE